MSSLRSRAVEAALDFTSGKLSPDRVRGDPLPQDTVLLIRIAGGCAETLSIQADRMQVSRSVLRDAARRYLLEALFTTGAPPERVLGMGTGTRIEDIGEHRRWLLRWLHPDHNDHPPENRFAALVNQNALELRERWSAHTTPPSRTVPPRTAGKPGTKRVEPHAHWQLAVLGLLILGCLGLWLTLPSGAPLAALHLGAEEGAKRSFKVDTARGLEAGLLTGAPPAGLKTPEL